MIAHHVQAATTSQSIKHYQAHNALTHALMASIKSHNLLCSTALHAHHHAQNAPPTLHVNNANLHTFISTTRVYQIVPVDTFCLQT